MPTIETYIEVTRQEKAELQQLLNQHKKDHRVYAMLGYYDQVESDLEKAKERSDLTNLYLNIFKWTFDDDLKVQIANFLIKNYPDHPEIKKLFCHTKTGLIRLLGIMIESAANLELNNDKERTLLKHITKISLKKFTKECVLRLKKNPPSKDGFDSNFQTCYQNALFVVAKEIINSQTNVIELQPITSFRNYSHLGLAQIGITKNSSCYVATSNANSADFKHSDGGRNTFLPLPSV